MSGKHAREGFIVAGHVVGYVEIDDPGASYADVEFTLDDGSTQTVFNAGPYASLFYAIDTVGGTQLNIKCLHRAHSDAAWIELQEDTSVAAGQLYADAIRSGEIKFQAQHVTAGNGHLSFVLK